jgi:hypothetical protein
MAENYDTLLAESFREFGELQQARSLFANHWEEVAELVLPTSRNTFFVGSYNQQGLKKTDRQVDSSAALALERFAAILDSLLTPRNQTWHNLEADDPYLMKDRATRLWFEQVTRLLFKYRYSAVANFSAQNNNQFISLGAFGNGIMFTDKFEGRDGTKGLRYKNLPVGEMFFRENHQGLIDGFIRWFRLTAQQTLQQFKDEIDLIPDSIKAAAAQNSQQLFEFIHRVCPRDDYDPDRSDVKGKLYASYHICLSTKTFLREGGYTSFPVAASRYIQTPGETYGRSPAMQVLPAIKTLNAEKATFLKQGHRAADPVLLTHDDGAVDISLRPGAINKGGVNGDGRPLIIPLQTGEIQISKEMMDEEKGLINQAFLVDLFQILLGDPKIFTATQVMEMMSQRGILIAPSVGRQQSEYLGPLIHREIDVLSEQGLLPPMPPLLREAGGEYNVVYSSPLARDMRAQEAAGFMRTIETAIQIGNVTQDPSVFDPFEFDVAIPAIAEINAVPESWMASKEAVAQKRDARAKLQQQQAQIQAMPAQAAMLKAQAVAGKAPQLPSQPQGQG